MNIFKKLAELADALDKRGLYVEASEIDEIIKAAQEPGWGVTQEPFTMEQERFSVVPGDAERERNKELLDRVNRAGQRDKVGKIQQRFNRLYDRLSKYNPPERMRSMFGDKLVVDRAWGPKTKAAYSKLKQMSDMLQWEVAKKQQQGTETGTAGQTPVINKNVAPTDQELMREVSKLSGEVKAAGGTPLDLHNMIKEVKYLMNEGKDLRGALDELRMRMMGA